MENVTVYKWYQHIVQEKFFIEGQHTLNAVISWHAVYIPIKTDNNPEIVAGTLEGHRISHARGQQAWYGYRRN